MNLAVRLAIRGCVVSIFWDGVEIWRAVCRSEAEAEAQAAAVVARYMPANHKRNRHGEEYVRVRHKLGWSIIDRRARERCKDGQPDTVIRHDLTPVHS